MRTTAVPKPSATSPGRRFDDLLRPDATPEWREVLLAIPGYDSIATAGDCRFDPVAAAAAIAFFPDMLRHIEGAKAGEPFELELWQRSILANLFGWKRLDTSGRLVRRYRECLLYVPRKNGKTPLSAGIALLVFFCDNEVGQQDYIAAGDREQAAMLFRQARGMVEQSPELDSRCRIYGGNAAAGQSRSLVREQDASFLRVISTGAETKHGGNTHLGVIDELHVQPNRDLVDVLSTSMASENRRQPLLILITTADYARPSICNEKYDYACKVRDRVIDDPSFLSVIYEATPEDDWKDEGTWAKANPNLGVSVSLDYLRRECKKAQEIPAYENTFKRLHLNLRTEQADRVIPVEKWDACRREIDLEPLRGRPCHAALDIGATSDFTALVLLFPHDGGEPVTILLDPDDEEKGAYTFVRRSFTLLPWFWLPEKPVRRNPRMTAVIDGWRRQGFVRTTPGEVVDYDLVLVDMLKILKAYELIDVAFDRGFQGSQMGNNLMKHFGDQVHQFPQGIISMNAPFREFLELITVGRIHHDGNPVMKWMVSNVAAEIRGGLMKPSKEKSAEKIDGVTAAVMALGRAMLPPKGDDDWYSPGVMSS